MVGINMQWSHASGVLSCNSFFFFPNYLSAGAKRSFPNQPPCKGLVVQALPVLRKECPRNCTSLLPLALPLAGAASRQAGEIQPTGEWHITVCWWTKWEGKGPVPSAKNSIQEDAIKKKKINPSLTLSFNSYLDLIYSVTW